MAWVARKLLSMVLQFAKVHPWFNLFSVIFNQYIVVVGICRSTFCHSTFHYIM